jgi:hypothetical protein
MWDLIVLGDIPGTSVKITFLLWLYTVGGLLWFGSMVWLTRTLVWQMLGRRLMKRLLLKIAREQTLTVQLQLFK